MISRIDIDAMADAQDEAPNNLEASIALIKDCTARAAMQGGDGKWSGFDLAGISDDVPSAVDDAIATILNAVVSGALARPSQAQVIVDLAAHLAAAISLLERGGRAAKKAAPSDKMFDQMMADYRASLERARAALAAMDTPKGGGDE